MLQSKNEKFISSFMQNKISKIIMLTIPIIESLISASIAFVGWFLEEFPVRFIRIVECVSRLLSGEGQYSHTKKRNIAAVKEHVKKVFYKTCDVTWTLIF